MESLAVVDRVPVAASGPVAPIVLWSANESHSLHGIVRVRRPETYTY